MKVWINASFMTGLTLASARARADEPPPAPVASPTEDGLEALRQRVRHDEEEAQLQERLMGARARREGATRGGEERASWAHRGRIVFPHLVSLTAAGGSGVAWGGLLSVGSQRQDLGTGSQSGTSVSFAPSVDWFVTDRWSLGLGAHVLRGTRDAPFSRSSEYGIGARPRVGRAFDAGPITIWTRAGVGYEVARSETTYLSSGLGGLSAGGTLGGAGALGGLGGFGANDTRSIGRTFTGELDVEAVLPIGKYLVFQVGPSLAFSTTDLESNFPGNTLGDGEAITLQMRAGLGVTLP